MKRPIELAREGAKEYERPRTYLLDSNRYKPTYLSVRDMEERGDYPRDLYPRQLWTLPEGDVFCFQYVLLVKVPADREEMDLLIDGPSWEYDGDDAPEGTLAYLRSAYLYRTEEGWNWGYVGPGTRDRFL